ncbi:hypothetical protein Z043_112783, partial [Scleropages formosus]
GRGVVVGPIISETRSDIFCDNENGPNFLFLNNGDGTFTDVASEAGIDDRLQHGRGVALADFDGDGKTDIVYGNRNGPHRLYLQQDSGGSPGFKDKKILSHLITSHLIASNEIFEVGQDTLANFNLLFFRNVATDAFATPSPVRTVIAADFDNDRTLEVFFNNIAYRGWSANRLFRVSPRDGADPLIAELNVGEAAEPQGRGTGGAAMDFDGDGQLDLLVAHGESASQPISVFKVDRGSSNSWLRVVPRTRFGAFARGAKVVVHAESGGPQMRIIDGGLGWRQPDPASRLLSDWSAGKDAATGVEVYWPDGGKVTRLLDVSDVNSVLEIPYPANGEDKQTTEETQVGNWELLGPLLHLLSNGFLSI